jgi:peroxiredoxin
MTLKQDIEAFTAEPAGRLPPELLADPRKSIDEVRRSGIAKRALAAGDTAPDSHCRTLTADRLRSPICSGAVRAYQTILSEIRAAGGDFIAISPQTPDNSLSTAEKNALKFEVLSDHGNRVASQFGIAYAIPEVVKKTTSMFGADIAAINGADDDRLPISATYVIGPDRLIVLASVDPDFRVRLEPADALAALRRLTADGASVRRTAGAA